MHNDEYQNLELVLENMIKVQAKLIEHVQRLNIRVGQIEYILQNASQQDLYANHRTILLSKNRSKSKVKLQ